MIAAVKTYQSHSYIVKDDKIAYKEQDTTSSDIVYGYNTLFAYYHEHEAGHISKESLQEHVSIYIDCGSFSYAKFPERFVHIMGVTGTLEHLSTAERKVMSEKYGIKHHTYMPSVYGENKRKFAKNGDIKIENEANYFVTLSEEINNRMQGRTHGTNRAVIIFFDDKEKLLAFKNSTEAKSILHPINELTEEAEDLEKKRIIKEASRSGKVTLLTRAFGRGTDFISYSPQVEANGGVHVIQAFLSEEKTEEIQIQGRTARQGQEGSYSMVLLDTDLEKFLIFEQDIKTMQSNGVFYDCLDEKRNQYFETQYASNSKHIHAMAKEHESSWSFVEALYKKDSTLIKNILMAKNKGANLQVQSSRTLCLMDATGSMAHLLQKAKNTVGTMFERATKILKDHGYPDGSFKLQFAVYRNYNVPADTILEYSSWESNSTNLYEFMTHITTKGGLGNEAIEIGLWHANREANTQESISQVILIGDAPPNTEEEVTNRRATYCGGESYWKATQFSEPTTTAKQLENLQQKKIPVHTFFVARRASQSFEEIATSTQDRYGNTAHCEFLDVNSTNGSEMLTEKITKGILRTTATTEEQANQFEKEYDKRFMKRHL